MTWSYDTALTETKDQVRFLVQDTDTDEQLVQDEEIEFALAQDSNVYQAASIVAKVISVYYARQVSILEKDIAQDAQMQSDKYFRLSWELAQKGSTSVYAGGISVIDMEAREDDTDRAEPKFTVALHQ